MTQTGASIVRPSYVSATTSAVLASSSSFTLTPSFSAVARLMKATLSQVSLVIGLGSSWSQPLLANRPSKMVGSGRKMTS